LGLRIGWGLSRGFWALLWLQIGIFAGTFPKPTKNLAIAVPVSIKRLGPVFCSPLNTLQNALKNVLVGPKLTKI
jgi:hypothetical protein